MTTLMGKSCGALVAQALPCCFVGVLSLSPLLHEPFLMSTSLEQGFALDRRVIASINLFYS
jgi:hypothetical protein